MPSIRHRIGNFGLTEELARYALVAMSAFALDLGLFYVLVQAGLNYNLSAVIAYVAGVIWNYFWSIHWAFAYRRLAGQLQEPAIFWLIALLGLLATVGMLNLLRDLGLGLVAAKILAEASIAIFSFTSKKLLLFSSWRDIAEVLRWYKAAPFSVKLHILIRRWTLPLDRLLKYVPPTVTNVLEIGTGYGLVLFVLAEKRKHYKTEVTMAGTDIDERKLEYARLAADGNQARIEFAAQAAAGNHWQAVLMVDVLYLLTPTEHRATIKQALDSLVGGGSLLIKEMAFEPAWKFRLIRLQEFIAVNILRITARQARGQFHFADLPALADELKAQGYQTNLHRLDKGLLHPHLLLVVQK